MENITVIFIDEIIKSILDIIPIIAVIATFQFVIIRGSFPNFSKTFAGLAYVILGLTFFRIGVNESLIPIGREMAYQLVGLASSRSTDRLMDYSPIFMFAALLGFTATLIEPTLTAAAEKVEHISGGSLRAIILRLIVACGVALGLVLGTLRIVQGLPLEYLLAGVIIILVVLILTAPREIVPLALDSGGITTSVVTVPLIAAYGAAVAEAMPNDATAADGLGLIILALLFPAIMVMAFALIQARLTDTYRKGGSDEV